MSIAFYQQSFLANALSSTLKPTNKNRNKLVIPLNDRPISSVYQSDDPKDSSRKNENQLAKLAIVTLAAGVLTLGSVDPASAAKTGGRVGGQAFRSSAPQSSLPRINNSRVNIVLKEHSPFTFSDTLPFEEEVLFIFVNMFLSANALIFPLQRFHGPMFMSILQLPHP
ncbi:uncharacterized protein LOC127794547 isoform X2 [Diospyros lotus]|uniref:uncharacterized protein LOC127794547 isoform X2 n=1 Tax=Diospyros lotus TaxID=55363 RepID=UPI0022517D35|nr:uncharacterized protein LOC127794547 isoform X2 [Diospyros lotus]